jgi:hypothetical protein
MKLTVKLVVGRSLAGLIRTFAELDAALAVSAPPAAVASNASKAAIPPAVKRVTLVVYDRIGGAGASPATAGRDPSA